MKRILIFYPYFTPAFMAGGPIQSIHNMVELIRDDFIIDVVCSAYDLGDDRVLQNIVPDKWNAVHQNVSVLYVRSATLNKVRRAFRERKPDLVYVNGIFLPLYSWVPLAVAKMKNVPVVFSPRGMLQQGAMANGLKKKRCAIWFLKFLNLTRDITWHATDEQERDDIRHSFDNDALISVVGNIPKPPLAPNRQLVKETGRLRLVYLSLISEKKNLALVLTLLKNVKTPIAFDIFGPVKDKAYWKECQMLMAGQIHAIHYRGPVVPADVRETVRKYHAFILLTRGENFGHAIYEALSAGVPVILSQYTPWGYLQSAQAGTTVDIQDGEACLAALSEFIEMDQDKFDRFSQGAVRVAQQYFERNRFKEMYISLFS